MSEKDSAYYLEYCCTDLKTSDWRYNYPDGIQLKPGWAFEFFVRDLFAACGFTSVHEINSDKTPGGDHGADIVANFGMKRCIIQCKHRSKTLVGPKDVREIIAAKYHYQASCCFIVSSTSFTDESYKVAKKLNVVLLSRIDLRKIIRLRGRTFRTYKGIRFRDQLNPFDCLNKYFRIPPPYIAGNKEDAVCNKDLDEYLAIVLHK